MVQSVPETFDQLVAQYDRLIISTIRRVSRGYVRADDIDDLRQAVYLRIHEKDYLSRCRELIAARGGKFSTYLFLLVRSVVINQFKKNVRNPLNMAVGTQERADREGDTARLVLETLRDFNDDAFERRQLAKDLLARFEAYIGTVRDHAELAQTLRDLYEDQTTAEIAAARGLQTRTVRRQRQRLQTLLHELALAS